MLKNTRGLHHFLLSVLLVAGAGTARADAPSDLNRAIDDMPPAATNGNYAGVAPGRSSKNPLPPAPAGSPQLIWTGFQTTATGSRVFLQTTSPISYDIKEMGHSTLVVLLHDCRIHTANNQRRLDTRAFPTPVRGFVTKQKRRDVELRITLREPATATPTTEAGPDGTQFVVLDFPPGQAESIESPTLVNAAGEGMLNLPADEDMGPRPSFSGYGSMRGTSAASAAQPTAKAPVVNVWNPSGLGVDETPARGRLR